MIRHIPSKGDITFPKELGFLSSGYKFQFAAVESQQQQLNSGELLKLEGPAIPLGKVSGNGRMYIDESVHAQVRELKPRIAAHALFGELDHPPVDDLMRLAYVKGTEISHRIDDIWFNEADNTYYIRVTVLDTPNGRIIKTLYDSGSPIYVSLRSLLDPNRAIQRNGYAEVWIMALITIDFVTRPGFADAELKPIPVANESMLAVCESLNIMSKLGFKNHRTSKQNNKEQNKFTQNQFNNSNMTNYAIESVAGVAIAASDDFQASVNAVILQIIEDFPNGFSFDEFNNKYSGSINGFAVGVYADTAELVVKNPAENIQAVIQLQKPEEDKYLMTQDAEVVYCVNDVTQVANDNPDPAVEAIMAKARERWNNGGKERYEAMQKRGSKSGMYQIVGTENYAPTSQFTDAMQSIHSRLIANFSNGFDESDFNDVLNVIADGTGFNGEIKDECIRVTCPDKDNGACITLEKEGDKYIIGDIAEYFNPEESATEAIIAAARFRWNNGGREKYAALESEAIKPADVEILEDDNAAAAAIVQQNDKQIVEDVNHPAKDEMYQVLEESAPMNQTFAVIDDNEPTEAPTEEPTEEPTAAPDDADRDDRDDIATEAARILGMPNSAFAGNYAIEHMPIAYKHLWDGLSSAAKRVIAKQAESVATEAQCLSFWQHTNFVAIEQQVVRAGNLDGAIAGIEAQLPTDPRVKFLGAPLPSRKKKLW